MKHRKKICILTLTLTMMFALIGCGSSTTPVLNENVEEKDGDEIADTLDECASVDEIVDDIVNFCRSNRKQQRGWYADV